MVEGQVQAQHLQRKQWQNPVLVRRIALKRKNAGIKAMRELMVKVDNEKLVGSIGQEYRQEKVASRTDPRIDSSFQCRAR